MKEIVSQLRAIWSGAAPAQRTAAAAGLVLLAGGLAAAVFFATRPDFALLFGNLEPSEASAVVDAVRGAGVAAEVRQDGRAVYVPRDAVAEMRMLVSKDGVPGGGSKGFELFDHSDFGVSDFEQNVKFQRALQGELSKSIMGYSAVEAARVAITRPRRSAFVGQDQSAKASVVVRVRAGRSLSRENVRAIVNLVAGAVEGLDPKNVNVMDQDMRVLSEAESDALAAQVNQQFDLRQREEDYLTRKAQEQLDRVGVRADVRVACELDFQNVRETAELYSDDGRALIQDESESKQSRGSIARQGGAAGVKAQLGDGGAPGADGSREETAENARQRFLPSRTVRSQEQAGARLKRLSISLVVHKEHEGEKLVIEDLVKRAVGFDSDRNDEVVTVVREFAAADAAPAELAESLDPPLLPMLLERGIQVLGILGALYLVLRIVRGADGRGAAARGPGQAGETAGARGQGVPAGAGAAAEAFAAAGGDPIELRSRVLNSVQQNPQVAARVLREWLRDGSGNA